MTPSEALAWRQPVRPHAQGPRTGHGEVRDVPGGCARALVHGALDAEGGVDDVADEEVEEAGAGFGAAEEDLGVGDGAGVVVHGDGQPEAVGELGGERELAPAEGVVAHDGPVGGADPAAERRADAEQGAAGGMGVPEEPAELGGDGRGQAVAGEARVREGPAGQDAAAEVDEAEGGGGHTDVQSGGEGAAEGSGVQVEGNAGAAGAGGGAGGGGAGSGTGSGPGAACRGRLLRSGAFAQQAGAEQGRGLPGHGGRAETAELRDVAPREGAVAQDGTEHGGGIGDGPAVTGGGGHGRAPRRVGCGPDHAVSPRSARAGELMAAGAAWRVRCGGVKSGHGFRPFREWGEMVKAQVAVCMCRGPGVRVGGARRG